MKQKKKNKTCLSLKISFHFLFQNGKRFAARSRFAFTLIHTDMLAMRTNADAEWVQDTNDMIEMRLGAFDARMRSSTDSSIRHPL